MQSIIDLGNEVALKQDRLSSKTPMVGCALIEFQQPVNRPNNSTSCVRSINHCCQPPTCCHKFQSVHSAPSPKSIPNMITNSEHNNPPEILATPLNSSRSLQSIQLRKPPILKRIERPCASMMGDHIPESRKLGIM